MTAFSYGTLVITKNSNKFHEAHQPDKVETFKTRDEALSALGDTGWELVSTEQPDGVATKGTLYLEMYFKKPQ